MFVTGHVESYRRFIDQYAPLGYAMSFARFGDFFEAQAVLEKGFIDGFLVWSGARTFYSTMRRVPVFMDRILEDKVPEDGDVSWNNADAPDFSSSPKLQSMK